MTVNGGNYRVGQVELFTVGRGDFIALDYRDPSGSLPLGER